MAANIASTSPSYGPAGTNQAYTVITADRTLSVEEIGTVWTDTTAGAITITYPDVAACAGRITCIRQIAGSANTALVTPGDSGTVLSALDHDAAGDRTVAICTGDAWAILGGSAHSTIA